MEGIQAWRSSALGAESASGSPVSLVEGRRLGLALSPASLSRGGGPDAATLTEQFARSGHLDLADRLQDGFRDTGSEGEAFATAGSAVGLADIIVVDRREDSHLVAWLDKVSKKLLRATDLVTRVMVASLLISETFGRSGQHAVNLQARLERLMMERSDASGAVKLGDLMRDIDAPGGSRVRLPGAGLARHRALLFKVVADWIQVAPCTLHKDEFRAFWNVLLVDGERFILDVMFDPGALYTEGSGKALEYLRRLRPQDDSDPSDAAAGSGAPGIAGRRRDVALAAPSVLQNLVGRMVRPSWHVEPWEIEFDRRDRAGRGGFGEVFQGTWAGQAIAVKEVRDASPTDSDVCDFILEISILSRLSHPNVIRFWRGCVDLRSGHRTLLLVTEWMDRGVLSSLLHEGSQEMRLTLGQMQVLATGIGLGLAYLHDVKILHLDLKSPNVLLNSSWQAKLCDFGLAKLREQTALHTTLRGVSPIWAPPEMFDDKAGGLTEKADVYSFGIIIFEISTCKLPYSDISQMQLPRVKVKGQLPKFPEDMDADLAEITKICLVHRPASRPSMQVVLDKIAQAATKHGIDLREEQRQMEEKGLHFGGLSGSTPNAEQLRRAEAEKLRAESEVARMRRLLEEEEARVRALKAEVARRGGDVGAGGEEAREKTIQEFCESSTQVVGEGRFRCAVCRKLFRGPDFVHKHVRDKHLDELLAAAVRPAAGSADAAAGAATQAPAALPSKRQPSKNADKFFDADIAEESNATIYTRTIAREGLDGGGGFNQSLQDAAEAGDLSKIQHCLLGGASLDQKDIDGVAPLHLSAKLGHTDCVQYLVSNSCDAACIDESGLTPLHWAAQEGHSTCCQILLEAGAVVNRTNTANERTALHLAAANGQKDVCRLLLMEKATVNLQDNHGETALHNAARFGDRELCEVILSFGATVNLTDRDGWSPLHEAARWGDGELVEGLLQRGADVAAVSNDGESALHVVPGGYAELEVVEVLLKWRCDVNCKDYDGEAPLHVAVKLGDAQLAGVLLNNGADANVANSTGATPLDFAKSDEVRWLLRSFKARKGTGA